MRACHIRANSDFRAAQRRQAANSAAVASAPQRHAARVGQIRAASDAANCASAATPAQRFAVVGAGFAGLAVAYHMLARGTAAQPVSVELLDAVGKRKLRD